MRWFGSPIHPQLHPPQRHVYFLFLLHCFLSVTLFGFVCHLRFFCVLPPSPPTSGSFTSSTFCGFPFSGSSCFWFGSTSFFTFFTIFLAIYHFLPSSLCPLSLLTLPSSSSSSLLFHFILIFLHSFLLLVSLYCPPCPFFLPPFNTTFYCSVSSSSSLFSSHHSSSSSSYLFYWTH